MVCTRSAIMVVMTPEQFTKCFRAHHATLWLRGFGWGSRKWLYISTSPPCSPVYQSSPLRVQSGDCYNVDDSLNLSNPEVARNLNVAWLFHCLENSEIVWRNWDCNVVFKIPLTAHDELAEFLHGCLIEFVCTILALWFRLLASHVAKVVKSAVVYCGCKMNWAAAFGGCFL